MTTASAFYKTLTRLQTRFDDMKPEFEVTVRDPVHGVEGHIVVWNTAISRDGPLPNCAKGGTRIRAGLTREEVAMLARNMALKNAAAGLPLGGCKSGLNADPLDARFEQTYRRFVSLCKPFTHENGGVFGGFGFDIGAAPEHALWACDTLGSTRSFTGKPLSMGGTDYDREGIAGLGVAVSAAELLTINNEVLHNIRFCVHGLGAMGAAVVRYFTELGARLEYLGDPKLGGSWRCVSGFSSDLIQTLSAQNYQEATALLEQQGKKISDDPNAVLFTDTDVLFPCAIQHVIDSGNVEQIKARYIVEGANNPCTPDVYPRTHIRGIQHIPDFIANAGGVIAAFVELTSDISDEENTRTRGKAQAAKALTRERIARNIQLITERARDLEIPLRDAAAFFALDAVLKHEPEP